MCPLGLPQRAVLLQAIVLQLLSTAAGVPPVSSAHSWPPERASLAGACSRTSPIVVGYADALVQVLPNVSHAALDTIDTISLAGARQQRVDFQLVLTPHLGSVPVDVTLALTPVRGADPAVGTVTPDVRRVDNVNIALASNAAKRTGWFPDPLRETASGKVPQDGFTHAVFWVTVSIPSSAEGVITGTVDITDATTGSQLCAIPYNVRVWDFTVPAASSETAQLTGAELSLSYAIPGNHSYYNPEGIPTEVVRTAMSNMFDHRINTQVFAAIYPPIALNISGDLSKVEINTMHFDDQVEWLLARGLRQFRFPTPSACGLAIKCGSTDPVHGDHKAENASINEWTFPGGKRLRIFKTVPPGHSPICELSSKFEDVFRRMHMPVVHHLKAKGWLNKTLVVLQDEPAWNDALTVCEWLAMAQLYKSLDPSIRIWQDRWPAGYTSNRTTLDSLYGAVGTSGTWIPDPLQYQSDQAAIKSAAERGVSFLSYDNAVPIIDLSPIRTRTFFWTIWRTNFDPVSVRKVAGLKGSLSWYGLSNWVTDPYSSANSPYDKAPHYRPAGLGVLLYPPWPGASLFDGVISSVRWEATRAGLEDAEYLMLLLDRITSLRNVCRIGHGLSRCRNGSNDIKAVVDAAADALKRVHSVVWDFPKCEWIALPVSQRRWNITEPYTQNISLLHEVLDRVALAIQNADRALDKLAQSHSAL